MNTFLKRFRRTGGCRMPCEVTTDYQRPGEVTTYRLTKEELARYGPVTPPEIAAQIRNRISGYYITPRQRGGGQKWACR